MTQTKKKHKIKRIRWMNEWRETFWKGITLNMNRFWFVWTNSEHTDTDTPAKRGLEWTNERNNRFWFVRFSLFERFDRFSYGVQTKNRMHWHYCNHCNIAIEMHKMKSILFSRWRWWWWSWNMLQFCMCVCAAQTMKRKVKHT